MSLRQLRGTMTDPIDTLARARRYFKSIVTGLDNEIARMERYRTEASSDTLLGLEIKAREGASELQFARYNRKQPPFIVGDEEEFEARAASIDEKTDNIIKGEKR